MPINYYSNTKFDFSQHPDRSYRNILVPRCTIWASLTAIGRLYYN